MSNALSQGIQYDPVIEKTLASIVKYLQYDYRLSKRGIATLLLQGDEEIHQIVLELEKQNYQEIQRIITTAKDAYQEPLGYVLAVQRQSEASIIATQVTEIISQSKTGLGERISRLTMQPLTGVPILLLVLYFGLYKFVGGFGAGTLVGFLEEHVFGTIINPWVNKLVIEYIPWMALQELLAKDYGIITLGIRYAISIILPIVGTFFIMFSIIEDSGYLPRLALLVDRVFKAIGLNGRAVIPMTLGFGCDTMATMVSRTLETKRERVIATLLLALAIPCSAQLGVILAILSGRPQALAVWVVFVLLVFLLVGYLTAKLMPGERPSFYMELPPLRSPNWKNVLTKTYTRMQWYLLEVLPLFILASILIWLGNITGAFPKIISWLVPVVNWIGLPDQAAQAFLFGFFRRDYGAAGLYDLQQSGALSGAQMVVAAATLTLFVPCIAQFTMMIKERGLKTAIAIAAFIFPFAFGAGYVLNWLIIILGVKL
jgi:ferrous iron transport protein B